MSYVQSVIKPNETVFAVGHMHWIVYLRGIILLVLGLGALLAAVPEAFVLITRIVAGLILVLAVLDLIRAWFIKWTTEIAVTRNAAASTLRARCRETARSARVLVVRAERSDRRWDAFGKKRNISIWGKDGGGK